MPRFDLSVVIPTYNAEATIGDLVRSLLAMPDLVVQVIVVDDCSTDATVELVRGIAPASPALTVLTSEGNGGAGVARNRGFALVEGRYVLFFDADDDLDTAVLDRAVRMLDEGGQDVAVLKYRYVRDTDDQQLAMNEHDIELWQRFLGGAADREVVLAGAGDLLGLTNYPWNKVLRTSVYREAGLRFSGTPVHNDILAHWSTLLDARRILLIGEVIATHVVAPSGGNLTNRRGRDRLALFDAFDETWALLASRPLDRRRYATHYWESVLLIAEWARRRIDPALRGDFDARLTRHVQQVGVADFQRMLRTTSPTLARRLVKVGSC